MEFANPVHALFIVCLMIMGPLYLIICIAEVVKAIRNRKKRGDDKPRSARDLVEEMIRTDQKQKHGESFLDTVMREFITRYRDLEERLEAAQGETQTAMRHYNNTVVRLQETEQERDALRDALRENLAQINKILLHIIDWSNKAPNKTAEEANLIMAVGFVRIGAIIDDWEMLAAKGKDVTRG